VYSDIAEQFYYESSFMTKTTEVADQTYYYAAYATFGLAVTSAGVYLATK
jgi:hypothetical protein